MVLNNIPEFEDALSSFCELLSSDGNPSRIVWVFRDDIWKRSFEDFRVRVPDQVTSSELARKVYGEGKRKGLVSFHGLASVGEAVAASVWFPRREEDEVQGWDRGLKLSFSEPFLQAKEEKSFRWKVYSLLPEFKTFQRDYTFVGTREWAEE